MSELICCPILEFICLHSHDSSDHIITNHTRTRNIAEAINKRDLPLEGERENNPERHAGILHNPAETWPPYIILL